MTFISDAFAEITTATTTDGGLSVGQDGGVAGAGDVSLMSSFYPLIIVAVIFYFIVFRPQMKKQKEHVNMLNNLRRGDKVVTSGGILATITKVEEESRFIQAEIGDGVKVRLVKSTLTEVLPKEEKDKKKNKADKKASKDEDSKDSEENAA